jgi:hypothetical protein
MKWLCVFLLLLLYSCSFHPTKERLLADGFKVENHASPAGLHEFDIYTKTYTDSCFKQDLVYYPATHDFVVALTCHGLVVYECQIKIKNVQEYFSLQCLGCP